MKTTKHYLCGVDYQNEMEMGLAHFYNSLDEIKTKSKCWTECGIIEIELDETGNEISHKWVEPQYLFGRE